MAEPTQTFELYPAIDILGGRCVRLLQGDYAAKTEYSANPADVAERWIREGARWLHVVDLDAAKSGAPENVDVIAAIVESRPGERVRSGGRRHSHGGGHAALVGLRRQTVRRWDRGNSD